MCGAALAILIPHRQLRHAFQASFLGVSQHEKRHLLAPMPIGEAAAG
jgi:hypothetical protein